jgi:hypothetical protein
MGNGATRTIENSIGIIVLGEIYTNTNTNTNTDTIKLSLAVTYKIHMGAQTKAAAAAAAATWMERSVASLSRLLPIGTDYFIKTYYINGKDWTGRELREQRCASVITRTTVGRRRPRTRRLGLK